ncbi:Lipoamide acyltransferase component of branched-chain alpha-keto acid dehydrogenase complex, mitochondrial [Linum perenne]
MIPIRILNRKRAWSAAGSRILSFYAPNNPLPSPPPVAVGHHELPFFSILPRLARSSHTVASLGFPRNGFISIRRRCFSGIAAADLPEDGIVDVPLAQTGEGIAECELLQWFVKEGDEVDEFQPLCEVQSDKATIEITSRYKGRVSRMLYVPGDIVKVGETLLKMLVEDSQVPVQSTGGPDSAQVNENLDNETFSSDLSKSKTGGILCTPAVRHIAKQYGISLDDIQGSGKDGRVLKEDILKHAVQKGMVESSGVRLGDELQRGEALDKPGSVEVVDHPNDKKVTLRGFQRAMVKTMTMAAKVPHFYYVEEIICDALVELKTSFQKNTIDPAIKHTFLPLLIKSLSSTLSQYPLMNSCFNEDAMEVILKGSHNIGIAMATPSGLVVPNIKNVQSLSILEITMELSRLQQLAVANKLSPEDITGGTVTLSNIGAIGGKFGSPLLNLPEVAIIAMGRIQKIPRFDKNGNVYPASVMTVNIGADHRVLDGATVARFCTEWKQLIEKPELFMLQLR